MAENVYKNKTVLITGHTGFKGSWLALWLSHLGANVVGYSLVPWTDPNLFDSLNLRDKITHIEGDVTGYPHMFYVFRDYNPEFVFHLAAQPIVRKSYNAPRLYYETNVMGTVNVLECIRSSNSVKSCVIVTSDKCYENTGQEKGYVETDALGGRDPYSSSKACAELVTRAYRDSFPDLSCVLSTVRAGNVVGGGDWGEDRLVPDFVRALQSDKPVVLRNPSAVRPWQYVLDVLSGYLTLGSLMYLSGKQYGGSWNFGGVSNGMTVESLVRHLIDGFGYGRYLIEPSPQVHEAKMLNLDSHKSRVRLGWYPVYSADEMVRRTVDWYKRFYDGNDMYCYSIDEIKDFEVFHG